ncbi:MAG: gamma-glutamylcyclotransferase family protein [Candidatus Wenzhouxiangella sp. M2_3B_020]
MKPASAFLYFAYGSNLMSARLKARCPSAHKAGNAILPRFRLAWHKVGSDDTGKCDAVFTGNPGDRVHGVAWAIRRSEMPALDYHEELDSGYYACNVPITIGSRRRLARTYRAIPTDPELKPLDWYKRFVVEGAREHGLPEDYIARLALTPSVSDADTGRRARNMRVR